jgi:hypothetical protein
MKLSQSGWHSFNRNYPAGEAVIWVGGVLMKVLAAVYQSVRYLLRIQIGVLIEKGNPHHRQSAIYAVFLPLAGLAVGLASMLAASLASAVLQMRFIPVLAGLAVLAAMGGRRQATSAMSIRHKNHVSNTGKNLFVILAVVFYVVGLDALQTVRGADFMALALLFLPSIGSLAMVSAASVLPEPSVESSLASVKGVHLVLASGLTLVLLLPAFGISSLAYMGLGVLAGSLTALIGGRKEYRVELLYAAAAFGELAFMLLLLVVNNPARYY